MNVIARGISMPKIGIGPESCQRMRVKLTSETSEPIAPTTRAIDVLTNASTSSWMRWSGLSTRFVAYVPRWNASPRIQSSTTRLFVYTRHLMVSTPVA
jgi:hypothetical protein